MNADTIFAKAESKGCIIRRWLCRFSDFVILPKSQLIDLYRRFICYTGEVVHLLQIAYFFSWYMLYHTLNSFAQMEQFTFTEKDKILTVVYVAFAMVLIFRSCTLWALYKKSVLYFNIFVSAEFVLVLIMFCLSFTGFTGSYETVPIKRAFGIVFISYCAVLFDYRLDQSRRKYCLLNICICVWGVILSQICHVSYNHLPAVQEQTNTIFKYLLPEQLGIISDKANIAWLSLGMPLFGSCLIIINWFKERPCNHWNPYTVQELGLSDHVVYYAVAFASSLFYCSINGMHRAPVFSIIGLLSVNVYALYLRNAQRLERPVMCRVIRKMMIRLFIRQIQKEEKDRKKDQLFRFRAKTKKALFAFANSIKNIMDTILSAETSYSQKANDYMRLVDRILLLIPPNDNVYGTVGFILGLSSVPSWLNNENGLLMMSSFTQQINDMVAPKRSLQSSYYKMLMTGILAGYAKMSNEAGLNNVEFANKSKMYLVQYGNPNVIESDEEGGDQIIIPDESFYNWLTDRWLSDQYHDMSKWKWVDDVWKIIREEKQIQQKRRGMRLAWASMRNIPKTPKI